MEESGRRFRDIIFGLCLEVASFLWVLDGSGVLITLATTEVGMQARGQASERVCQRAA
jgi:hypothetical protein